MTESLTGTQSLIKIMTQLRDPDTGCPWDREQDFSSIAPFTIEEAYEVADAIARKDINDLKEELGDLLFQVVFHARLAEEQGLFDFDEVATAMSEKLIRRHPHVFSGGGPRSSEAQTVAWEETKAEERKAKNKAGILDDVPIGLPALTRAAKLTKRAARVGFDWINLDQVFEKLDEEVAELKVEIQSGVEDKIKDELGDVLFVLANLARKLSVEPEAALRGANAKFARRFGYIAAALDQDGIALEAAGLERMEALWDEAKQEERA